MMDDNQRRTLLGALLFLHAALGSGAEAAESPANSSAEVTQAATGWTAPNVFVFGSAALGIKEPIVPSAIFEMDQVELDQTDDWGVYNLDFNLADTANDNPSYILYGNVTVCSHALVTAPSAASTREKECLGSSELDIVPTSGFESESEQLLQLKRRDPHLTVLASLGAGTAVLPWNAGSSSARETVALVNSTVRFLELNPVFDGVNFTWDNLSPAAVSHHTGLLSQLRVALENLTFLRERPYLLTVTLSSNTRSDQLASASGLASAASYAFVVAGDFLSRWLNRFETDDNNSFTEETVDALTSTGVPRTKIRSSVTFYGRTWVEPAPEQGSLGQLYPLLGQFVSRSEQGVSKTSIPSAIAHLTQHH